VETAEEAAARVKLLVKGRMEGDYNAHRPVNKDVAADQLAFSRALCVVLFDEAGHMFRGR
jgi:hypothetical protein